MRLINAGVLVGNIENIMFETVILQTYLDPGHKATKSYPKPTDILGSCLESPVRALSMRPLPMARRTGLPLKIAEELGRKWGLP